MEDLNTADDVDYYINTTLGYLAEDCASMCSAHNTVILPGIMTSISNTFYRLAKSSGMAHPPSADHSDDFDTYEFAENYIRFALKSIEEELPKLALDYPDRLSIVDALSMVSHHMHSLARSRGMINRNGT